MRLRRALALAALSVAPALSLEAQTYTIEPWLSAPRTPAEWDFEGTGTWDIAGGRIAVTRAGTPVGPIRKPAAIAVIKMDPLTKATVGMQVRSTAPTDVPQRDLLVVVGYQSPTRFYYVQIAGARDADNHGIFLVDGADAKRIDEGPGVAQIKDQAWHDVRVEWDGTSGTINLFVDHGHKPALTAYDATIQEGRIGIGSFDDTGEFKSVRVSGSR